MTAVRNALVTSMAVVQASLGVTLGLRGVLLLLDIVRWRRACFIAARRAANVAL
jgi:hypothetical protein